MLYINEWRFALRQPLVLLSLILTPLFAFLLSVGVDTDGVSPEKQLQVNLISLQMLALTILVGILSPLIMLRDIRFDMEELINSTPVSSFQRWLFRFLSLLSIVMLIFCLSAFVSIMSYSFQSGFQFSFIRLSINYLFWGVLPSCMLLSVVSVWIMKNRLSAMTNYVLFMMIWIGYLLLASMNGSPVLAGSSVVSEKLYQLMLWLDPHGITPVLEGLNQTNIDFDWRFIGNRLIILSLSLCLLYLFLIQFKELSDSDAKSRKSNKNDKNYIDNQSENKENLLLLDKKYYQTVIFRKQHFLSTLTLIKTSLFSLLKGRLTQLILAGWSLLIFNEVLSGLDYVEAFSQLKPNSIDALNRISFDLLPLLSSFLLALWSWLVCTRNKRCHIHELIAVTPVKNYQLIVADMLTLWIIFFILLLLTGLSCRDRKSVV